MARTDPGIDGILDRYALDIHDAYRTDFSRLRDTARSLADDGRDPAGMRAALDKTAAYMANEDRPYSDLEEEYGVGTSAIHIWVAELHDRADIEMEFNGHPEKILDAAADEAATLVEVDRLGKMAAARRVADRHGVNPGSVKRRIPGDGHSRYATDGTTQRLYDAITTRPRTTVELVDRVAPDSPPGNYLRRRDDIHAIDHTVPPPDTDRIVVWYRDGDRETAGALRAAARASREHDPHTDLPGYVAAVRDHVPGDVRDDWDAHWEAVDEDIASFAADAPQHFTPVTRVLPDVTDYLLAYDDRPEHGTRTHFDAEHVAAYLDGYDDGDVNTVSHLLKVLEDRAAVLDGVGGKPRKFDSRTIDEPGVLVTNAIVDRHGGNAFIPAARER